MVWQVLIAHADGEEQLVEQLAGPIRNAGYEVAHRGTVMVGESVTGEASKVLSTGGPVVLCGTVRAMGTGWAHRLVNAARRHPQVRVFAVQMEKEAYLDQLSLDGTAGMYWQDPSKAVRDLVASLQTYYPLDASSPRGLLSYDAERRYRELLLKSCDIIDLGNLPESDRHRATRQLELRRLYVALRVRVEIPFGSEAAEQALDAIEKRRDAMAQEATHRSGTGRLERPPDREPVGRRLAQARRLVVLGDPGAGKTTMIRWIATSYLLRLRQDPDWKDLPDVATLPAEDWLPIVVRCRDLGQACVNGSLEDILRHTLRKAEIPEADIIPLQFFLRERLNSGKALLMLDGLDEITDPATRIRFCQHVEQIHVACPKAPIIATSRIVGYREMGCRIGKGFEHVTVAELSKEDKDDFARRWCALSESPERRASATAELIHDIHSSDRIERLTGSPMLLTVMALVKRKVGRLPSRRADLYWDALEALLNWRREVDEPIDHREAVPQLEYVAYAMCDRGILQVREDELVSLCERMRQEYPNVHAVQVRGVEDFLRVLERRTGILVQAGHVRHSGRPVPVYEFRHLTFQEYLAALALVDGRFPGRDRSRRLADQVAPLAGRTTEVTDPSGESSEIAVSENWSEALRLCVACCNDDDVDAVLRGILKPLAGEDDQTTGRVRAILAALCLADEPNASDTTVRAILEEFIRHVGASDGTGLILSRIDAAAVEVARSRWADLLRSLLLTEFIGRDPTTRRSAGELCARMTTSVAPSGEAAIREWFAAQAARIASTEESVAIDGALAVMDMAFSGRAQLVPGTSEGLLAMLGRSAASAHAAAWALYWLNDERRKDAAWRPSPSDTERVLSVIGDAATDIEAVRFLIAILGHERESRAVDALLVRLRDVHSRIRQVAASALGQIGDVRATDALIEALEDEDEGVRQASVVALGGIGDTRSVDSVLGSNPSVSVALGACGVCIFIIYSTHGEHKAAGTIHRRAAAPVADRQRLAVRSGEALRARGLCGLCARGETSLLHLLVS